MKLTHTHQSILLHKFKNSSKYIYEQIKGTKIKYFRYTNFIIKFNGLLVKAHARTAHMSFKHGVQQISEKLRKIEI